MSSRDPIPNLRQRLGSVRLELALTETARRLGATLWQWLLLAAAIVLIDALWPARPWLLLLFAIALAAGGVRIIWSGVPRRVWRCASPARLAREMEQRFSLAHNPLITAVQLQAAPSVAGPQDARELLIGRTAERAEHAAADSQQRRLVDPAVRLRSGLALLGAVLFIAVAALVGSRPIAAVATRVIDPFGDHPPYTPLTFDIAFTPDAREIVYGDDATVMVSIDDLRRDGLVERAELVCRPDAAPATPTRIALHPEPLDLSTDQAHRYTAALRDVREPMRVMINTPRGRSEWMRITPRLDPRWVSRSAVIVGPEYAPQREPRRLPLADHTEPIRMLQGSRLTVEATSTLPLTEMRIDPAAAPATLSHDRTQAAWNWSAEAPDSHAIDLTLIGPTGAPSSPTHLQIEVVADAAPSVSIRQPSPRAAALPDQHFHAAIEAVDDVSVGDLTCTAQVQRDGHVLAQMDLPVSITARGGDHAAGSAEVDLAPLRAQPGDTVRLVARARDERPEQLGGSQSSAPAVCDILIIDQRTYESLAGRGSGAPGADSDDARPGDEPGDGDEPASADGEPSTAAPGPAPASGENGDEATGRGSGESGVPLAGAGDFQESAGGQQQGGGDPPAAPGDAASAPSSQAGGPGSAESSSAGESSATGAESLLSQAQSRDLIQRDGSVQPISGRADPNAPRQHLTSVDDPGAPPPLAESRSVVRSQGGAATDAADPLARIPLRYRDLAARYFNRLAQNDRAANQPEAALEATNDE